MSIISLWIFQLSGRTRSVSDGSFQNNFIKYTEEWLPNKSHDNTLYMDMLGDWFIGEQAFLQKLVCDLLDERACIFGSDWSQYCVMVLTGTGAKSSKKAIILFTLFEEIEDGITCLKFSITKKKPSPNWMKIQSF